MTVENKATQHTPGPWYSDNRDEDGSPHADWHVRAKADDALIMTATDYEGYETPNAKANARLIAAAPDLLEALEAAHEWFALNHTYAPSDPQEGEYYEPCEAPGDDCEACNGLLHVTAAAIAKARGAS